MTMISISMGALVHGALRGVGRRRRQRSIPLASRCHAQGLAAATSITAWSFLPICSVGGYRRSKIPIKPSRLDRITVFSDSPWF